MSIGTGEDEDRGPDADEARAPAEPPGGIVIGEFAGGAVAAGERATAEDSSRTLGARGADAFPPPVVAPLPGGIAIGRMTGGAAASGPGAQATSHSEQFIEATPQLIEALALLRDETGELRAEAALAEREIRANGGVEQGLLRRLAALAGRAAGSVGGQTAAAVAAETITGMLT
ncbi:hypothetical protein GCM10015535_55690 [Streptomyces gelaticus]|uniref:Uncharacterized protein n=1 Tax=Streptomyces gelaticus TaxID=285446 RepID=A0ABQ2W973_9ACTN|nr:hypothetical protein [Streptomyces gelaticus]GGV93163.1 hypothetical protein GCM10015535_55690 [Streptomyces gelaticus]